MSFKKVLFIVGMVGLVGPSYALEGDYTKVKEYEKGGYTYTSLYKGNKSGKCYFEERRVNRLSISEVDCRDHGIPDKKVSKNITPSNVEKILLQYIDKHCVVMHPEGFTNSSTVSRLEGKKLNCTLPKDFDEHTTELLQYEKLKKRFEGK